jgi:hypothetical protein
MQRLPQQIDLCRLADLYPTSCIRFVKLLTTHVRVATILAEADRNRRSRHLRERFLSALHCEHHRLSRKLA